MRLTGRAAIEAFWRDVCARDMTHRVGREAVAADRAAFIEECRYPDGCAAMSAMTLDMHAGLIVPPLAVSAIDLAA
jgi:hypothetical protein